MNTKEVMVRVVDMVDMEVPVRLGYDPFKKEDIDFIAIKKPPYLFLATVKQKK
jgi:hypothetical protein